MILPTTIKKKILIMFYRYRIWIDKKKTQYLESLNIMSIDQTVEHIIQNRCSCSRYGDGEFLVMSGSKNGFQKKDEKLARRLKEVIDNPVPNLLICMPSFLTTPSQLAIDSQLFSYGYIYSHLNDTVMPFVPTNRKYGDSLFTRFYMNRKDKSNTRDYINRLKRIWNEQELLIVEGEYSRLGVGNDLFDNAKNIKRILCPQQNAFDHYDEIISCIKDNYNKELIVLALGMTATILAYDLTKEGMRALDLGHLDVEYEWYRMGATHKVPIPNKQMSEVSGGACYSPLNSESYLNQIIANCCK